jgi:predicted glycosyltransferase involved in capsule biosynthesis
MKKIALQDVTFLIPVSFDSMIRLENTLSVVSFIHKNFNTNIFVLEASSCDNHIFKRLIKNEVEYFHFETYDIIFHKTKYLNILTQKTNTPFLAIWDADVIADKSQILDAVEQLRKNDADVSYPYDGRMLDTSDTIRTLYFMKKNIDILHKYKDYMNLIYGDKIIGGAVIVDSEKYRQTGMDNEDFYGWGNEDFERHYRFENLGYRIYRSKGPLYHLTHPRDINGRYRSKEHFKITTNMVNNIRCSSKNELISNLNNSINPATDVKPISS